MKEQLQPYDLKTVRQQALEMSIGTNRLVKFCVGENGEGIFDIDYSTPVSKPVVASLRTENKSVRN